MTAGFDCSYRYRTCRRPATCILLGRFSWDSRPRLYHDVTTDVVTRGTMFHSVWPREGPGMGQASAEKALVELFLVRGFLVFLGVPAMDGPLRIGRRTLVRDFVVDRHSTSLLAKAFEEIDLNQLPPKDPSNFVPAHKIEPPKTQLQETLG